MQHQRRPATARDGVFLWALHNATLKDYVTQTWGWDDQVQRRMFDERFDPARIEILVCEGQDVGALAVEQRPDELWLAELQIAPAWQGRGLGTAILRDLIDEANARGVPVGLRVLRVNPARALYERLGFVVVSTTETHHLMSRRFAGS
jgi:GNAT superfamily N-acetyltransferase